MLKKNKINYYLKIIDQIEKTRGRNNFNWMDILRIALIHAPEKIKRWAK